MIKFKNITIILTLILCFSFVVNDEAHAQYLENDPTPAQRVFWGGNIGLMFGTNTYISINPTVGYRLTNRLSAGIGGTYNWTKSVYYDYSGQSYGANIFASFTIIKRLGDAIPINDAGGLLLYGELSYLNISNYYVIQLPNQPAWVYTPLAGIAYQSPIGQRSYLVFMVLYNFSESYYSPYSNPVIKASFQF
ncbi:MAG: hypothetical protein PHE33_12130 [Bacteroidales bacterium]|nr:hypothetical protein [Bacteroidales bacterium]